MMRTSLIAAFGIAALCLCSGSVFAQNGSLAGVPMKHSAQTAGQCIVCHDTVIPQDRPNSQKCIQCHGPMLQIKTAPNPQGKNPHQSDHYADTLDCDACHAEHKPSKSVCERCHVVEFKNFR